MRRALALVALVACAGAPAPGTEVPSSAAPSEPATEPEPTETTGEPAMTENPRQIVQAWADARFEAPERTVVSKIGTATGHPAYVVSVGDRGQRPEREQVVVVVDGDVLVGRSGWRVFLAHEGREDATRVAAAWLALYRGEAREPYGNGRTWKKKVLPDPRWDGDRLVVHYSGHRSVPHVAALTIDDNDTVTVVSDEPWSEPPPF